MFKKNILLKIIKSNNISTQKKSIVAIPQKSPIDVIPQKPSIVAIPQKPPIDVIPQKPSIVVIGNGPSVLNNNYGDVIDKFDEVVRINHYKPSINVGSKLTIFFCSSFKTIYYKDVPLLSKKIIIWDENNVKTPYNNLPITEIIDKKPIQNLLYNEFNFNIFPKHPWCSTGIATLMYLILSDKYNTIYIYGFDNLIKNEKTHYFEDVINKISMHSPVLEKNFIEHYIKLGKLCKLETIKL